MPAIRNMLNKVSRAPVAPPAVQQKHQPEGRQQGSTVIEEDRISRIYNQLTADPSLRSAIFNIRALDKKDGRFKTIHRRTAALACKGGVKLTTTKESNSIQREWMRYSASLHLDKRDKLESDARGLMKEGNLCIQWVLNGNQTAVVRGVRMPTETIKPITNENGEFQNPAAAYHQIDSIASKPIATFPLWQLTVCRLDPDNYDDWGSMGRPWLDAVIETALKLRMTETDMVVRRRERAPLRTAHILEGAEEPALMEYKARVESDQKEQTTNYYLNKKGGVQAIQGDTNLSQIDDIKYLLDTFFAGSPAAKAIFGYNEEMNRDILEDLKTAYFEELAALQNCLAMVYQAGFELHLLLQGINPDSIPGMKVEFKERRTESPNQATDRAIKVQALGASHRTSWEIAGLDPDKEVERIKTEKNSRDPYPDIDDEDEDPDKPRQRVKITPGNAPKKESATSVSN